jgi:SET domain-containing protein
MPKNKYIHNSPFSLSVKRSSAGLGAFTNEPIKKGVFVLEYTGELIPNEEADRRGGKYLFNINSKWTVDGRNRENLSRHLNHSCRPNCEAKIKKGKILIYSIKNIKAGEELVYDYGKEYFDAYIKPHGCRCPKCNQKTPLP